MVSEQFRTVKLDLLGAVAGALSRSGNAPTALSEIRKIIKSGDCCGDCKRGDYECEIDILTKRNAELEFILHNTRAMVTLAENLLEKKNQRIDELEEKQRWIPVSERFPEIGPAVLVLHESGWICTTGWIVLGQKINEPNPQYGKKDRPTHWMLIPKAPGVGDE